MDFGDLLKQTKKGDKVTRSPWGGSFATHETGGDRYAVSSQVAGELGIKPGTTLIVGPYLQITNANGVTSAFVPTMDDLLASDYVIRA